MMSGLDELYQDLILDHSKRPRNFGRLEPCTHHAEGYNPLCGDRCDVTVQVDDGRITALKFDGVGCAISTASASLMTEAVTGHTVEEAAATFDKVHKLLTADEIPESDDLGKLEAFTGVRRFPMRVKCATLAWHTLTAALRDKGDVVSTE